MLLRFRPTNDIWPLHLLDLSGENKLSTFPPLALNIYLNTYVFQIKASCYQPIERGVRCDLL